MTVTVHAETGETGAKALLRAGRVTLKADELFRLPSGWASPVYMDCRRLISFPPVRRKIVSLGVELLRSRGCLAGVASIAGGETSGILSPPGLQKRSTYRSSTCARSRSADPRSKV
jgi:orotate phosphoribosyltransferase